MIIECKECGAPLDVEQHATLARCHYCGRTQRVRSARTQYPVTPPNWNPPPQWTPPPHFPARSVPLRYDASKKVGTIIAIIVVATTVVPLLIVGGVVFAIVGAGSRSSSAPSPPHRGAPVSPPAAPDVPASGGGPCAAAARCCKALGTQATGCENIVMVPDENACRQILEGLQRTAEQLGKSCE